MSENTEQGPYYNMDCPVTGQDHNYFLSKTVEVYELYSGSYDNLYRDASDPTKGRISSLYEKKEYGLLGCKCGSAVRKEIETI